jgi:hypothetical protein
VCCVFLGEGLEISFELLLHLASVSLMQNEWNYLNVFSEF